MKPREDGGAQILDLGQPPGFHFACQKGQAVDFGRVAGNNRFELRSKARQSSPRSARRYYAKMGHLRFRPGPIRPVWMLKMLKRSDDPDGSGSGVEEFEVHD